MNTGVDPCGACRAGFHNECYETFDPDYIEICCCGGEVKFTPSGDVKAPNAPETPEGVTVDFGYIDDGYGASKDLADYKDPVSTGRKRAAEMYPISTGMVCEWAGLAKAGGGVVPIVGCVGRPASDRHHGPDKNTMNNAPTNLHRICDHCHNTWHALNDPHYGPRPEHTQPFIPEGVVGSDWFLHDAKTVATTAQILEAENKRLEDR
jgi:hypothetical protein